MIIDTHYHLVPRSQDQIKEWFRDDDTLITFFYKTVKKLGHKISFEDFVKKAIETWGDPTGDRTIASMDESGIDVSVILNVDDMSDEMQDTNKHAGEVSQKYPDRLIALAGVDPRRENAADMLKQCFEEFGMKGLKYHPDYGFDPSSPESYKLLEVLSKYKGVLVTHTGPIWPPTRPRFAEPMLLADIAVDFPDVKVVAAHMGYINWRPWAALAAHQPNLYGDLAMWDIIAFGHYELFCRELRDLIDFVGAEKVLFGTDNPFVTIFEPTKKWIQLLKDLPLNAPEGIKFSKDEIDAILGKNATSVFTIK